MKTLKATLLVLLLAVPLLAVNHPDKHRKHERDPYPVAVPEGGGAVAYMLVSAAAVVGVLAFRKSKSAP